MLVAMNKEYAGATVDHQCPDAALSFPVRQVSVYVVEAIR